MPSLFCISESEAARSDRSCEKEELTAKSPRSLIKGLDGQASEIDQPVESSEGPETAVEESADASCTPKSKKRKVTPDEDSNSKQRQQKKVNQMTLSSFFFQKAENKSAESSSPSKGRTKKRTKSPASSKQSSNVSPSNEGPSPASKSKNLKTERPTTIDPEYDEDQSQWFEVGTSVDDKVEKAIVNDEQSAENDHIDADHPKSQRNDSQTEPVSLDVKPSAEKPKPELKRSRRRKKVDAAKVESACFESGSKKQEKSKSKRRAKSTTKESTNEKSTDGAASEVAKTLSEEELDTDRRELLQKYMATKAMYLERALELVRRNRNGLREENLGTTELLPILDGTELKRNDGNLCQDFPTQVVTNIGLLIEGCNLPLSKLLSKVSTELNNFHGTEWCQDSLTTKIKLVSQRKAYLDPTQKDTKAVDLFEDDDRDRLWRWEFATLDLLPSDFVSKARKARTARKKVSSYHSALLKLLKSLDEVEHLILNPSRPKLDASKAKISRDEEKVLKFEREAEKQRLADEAKAKKLLEQEAKKKAKEEALEAKKRAKEEALEAKRRKKEEAIKAREDEKRKKEEEKLREEEEKKQLERKKLEKASKQKATFRSFFASAPKKLTGQENAPPTIVDLTNDSFDVVSFRGKINSSSEPLSFSLDGNKRSKSAALFRKRRTKQVHVSVYKTVVADTGEWGASDYLEQTTIQVPNRYRFLSFHEDCRPAYRGTWTKSRSIITGKNPFGKDTSVFDYEYDSEAEWEEGDDEMGENVDDDDMKDDDEEADGDGNAKMYDFEDGFCVADDKLLDNEEDADEDTKALYKKKMQNRDDDQIIHANRIRIIAPAFGGVPLHTVDGAISTSNVQGFEADEISAVLASYQGIQLSKEAFCLDAFPPLYPSEDNRPDASSNANNKDDYPVEAMVALSRFAHHSTFTSKDKLVEELRSLHPALFTIRAKATRKLDSIAVKKKHPKFAGVYWEVKPELLKELGLTDVLAKKVEDIVYEDFVSEKAPSSKEVETPKKASKTKNKSPGSISKETNSKKSKTETSGSDSKKRKAGKKNSPSVASSSKKKIKVNDNKDKLPSSSPQSKVKKDSPVSKKDVSAGMKNIMAQFVKRSPVKPSPDSSTNAERSSVSQ